MERGNGRLRIGLLCPSGWGGTTQVAIRVGEELLRRGHRVVLFSNGRPDALEATAIPFGGSAAHPPDSGGRQRVRWTPEETEAVVRAIEADVRGEGLDVLHVHYAVPLADVALRSSERLGRIAPRLVLTLHGTDVSLFAADPLAGRTLGRRLGGFDRLTTPSLAHAELAHRLLALRSLPDVVHNSVEPRSSAAAIRRTWSPPRIAHVSSFRPVKDPALMAEVYLRLRRSTEAELWLIGDGPGLASTRERIREGGHLEDVRVFGVRTDVEPLLRRTDVCAVTSRTESFSLAALEAAACGLPVVAPRVGGIPEVVLDGRTGLLLPGGDATAAVRALERLLRDPALRARLGAAAAVRARAFSTARAADAYERIYRSVLGVSVASGPEPAPAGRGAGPPAAGSSRPPAGGSRRSR